MEWTDTKTAIVGIGLLAVTATTLTYVAGVLDGTVVTGIFSTAVAAMAGLAGYDAAQKKIPPGS